jgi:uncharacterized Zn finger protein
MDEHITLDNFRNELEEDVLERGWMYFNNGWVKHVRELMPDFYEAQVEEVNPHAVSFSFEEERFTDFFCTCADPSRLICKHMTAVIFYFEAERQALNRPIDWDMIERQDLERKRKK